MGERLTEADARFALGKLSDAAKLLLAAHEAARAIPPHERTALDSDLADLGRNRLKRIISRASFGDTP